MKDIFLNSLLNQIRKDVWGWVVWAVVLAAMFPIAWGCWIKPEENNIAAFSIWGVLAIVFVYSFWKQGFSGWRLPFGYLVGNIVILTIAAIRGGYFELGPAEQIVLFGIIGSVSAWKINQVRSGRAEPRILYYGCLLADIASFYPMMKQWMGPANASFWMLFGWVLYLAGVVINLVKVEEFFSKLKMSPLAYRITYRKEKSVFLILEESLFSIEQILFIVGMMSVMIW